MYFYSSYYYPGVNAFFTKVNYGFTQSKLLRAEDKMCSQSFYIDITYNYLFVEFSLLNKAIFHTQTVCT